jgi:regulator of sigma E protease
VFSLGFGPVLYSRVDKRGTVWQIAALPFGGYVKFAGDANAASGKDDAAMEAAQADPVRLRSTMHGAPLWARAATVAAGPLFNFAMSIIIFTVIALQVGVAKDPLTVGELRALPFEESQLKTGDEILSVAGIPIPSADDATAYSAAFDAIPLGQPLYYDVMRDGQQMTVPGPYIMPTLVKQVMPQSAAYEAGLLAGDVITGVDGVPIFAFSQLKKFVEAAEGRALLLTVWRDGETLEFTMKPKVIDEPQPDGSFKSQTRIGIAGGTAFDAATTSPGVVDALWAGVTNTGRIIQGSISGLKHMIIGDISTCNLSGPVGIAQTSGAMASQGAQSFIYFIAVLSTAVGLLNLFPIPALDGGHLVFYAYEAVTGKPPSDGALRILMTIGLTLVLGLMVFALGNDIFCP